jgi:hypothetical protein
MVKRFNEFINETYLSPIKSQIKKFGGKLKHKQLISDMDDLYNVWIAEDEETSNRITKLYTGKYALDLGGYAPSKNDLWLHHKGYSLIIKTNRDNIIPSDVIIQAATILRKNAGTHKLENDKILLSFSNYIKFVDGEIIIDDMNSGFVIFVPGNVKVQL